MFAPLALGRNTCKLRMSDSGPEPSVNTGALWGCGSGALSPQVDIQCRDDMAPDPEPGAQYEDSVSSIPKGLIVPKHTLHLDTLDP